MHIYAYTYVYSETTFHVHAQTFNQYNIQDIVDKHDPEK